MKRSNQFILFVILAAVNLFSIKFSYSQWTLAGGITNLGVSPSISAVDQNTVWCAGGYSGVPMITRTTNGGLNWTSLPTNGILTELLCIRARDANTLFAGDAGINGKARFYKTTDAGISWIVLDSIEGSTASFNGIKFSESIPLFGIAVSGNIDGCGTQNFIYKTHDGGNIWTKKQLTGYPGEATSVNSLIVIDSLLYAFGTTMGLPSIVITTDGGSTWNLRNTGLPSLNESITSGVAFSSNKLNGISESSSLPLITRTTNGGINWQESYLGVDISGHCIMKWIPGTDICFLSAAHAPSGAILKSTNGGLNWIQMTTANLTISNFDVKKNGQTIFGYAVTCALTRKQKIRILKLKQNISREDESQSSDLSDPLSNKSQNYPNPFNPKTVIRYSLNRNSFVKLNVYDIFGKLVISLVNGNLKAGSYEVNFDGSNYSSGVYFYRLEEDGFVDTKKMYLVK